MPHPRHILIVDDDATMRELLVYLIARTYVDVTIDEVATGAEALSAVAAQPPDLIISDCYMPVMDGLQLVRTLRGQGATMPIVMLSSEPSVVKVAQLAGATAFLPKPLPCVLIYRETDRSLQFVCNGRKRSDSYDYHQAFDADTLPQPTRSGGAAINHPTALERG